ELGGLHDNVLATALEAKKRGHNVVVACRSGLFNDKLLDAGIKTIITDLNEYTDAMDEIKSVMGNNIDLIHCHPGSSRVVAMRLNKELNIPVIYHVHGGWVDSVNFYIDRVESVFTVSESVKKKVVEKCGGYEYKVHVIPNYS
ncbi:glycosyltransferase, partial [Escherichia coli]|uniref:glycosyltransferase n=1 Tax=Escherichia coli TaxID=562 RepID=UPI0013033F3A